MRTLKSGKQVTLRTHRPPGTVNCKALLITRETESSGNWEVFALLLTWGQKQIAQSLAIYMTLEHQFLNPFIQLMSGGRQLSYLTQAGLHGNVVPQQAQKVNGSKRVQSCWRRCPDIAA